MRSSISTKPSEAKALRIFCDMVNLQLTPRQRSALLLQTGLLRKHLLDEVEGP